MKKFFFATLLLIATFAMVGCGDSADNADLLTARNVNDILDEFRSTEKDMGYEIHDVKYGENNGEHFCSAVFDKDNRGSVYFHVTEKGSVISAKFSMTDAKDYDLNYHGGFLLTRVLFSAGLTQDEIQKFLQEQTDLVNTEIAKQQKSLPTINREFIIRSSKSDRKIAVLLKADENELSYKAGVAK